MCKFILNDFRLFFIQIDYLNHIVILYHVIDVL